MEGATNTSIGRLSGLLLPALTLCATGAAAASIAGHASGAVSAMPAGTPETHTAAPHTAALHAAAPHSAAPLPPNPLVVERVAAVSEDEIAASLERLVGFHTRHTNSSTTSATRGIGATRGWVHSRFAAFSAGSGSTGEFAARYFDFRATVCGIEGAHRNVVATVPGAMTPERHMVVLAHMDSRTRNACDATAFAPGANDDGSGTAVLIEVARLLAEVPLESTVVLQAVTGEEQGLFGSTAWAEAAEAQGMRLDAVVTNDVVGNTTGCVNPACPPGEPRITDRDSIRHFSDGPATSNHRQLARSHKLQGERYLEAFNVTLIQSRDRPGRGGDHIPFSTRGWASTRFTEPHEDGDGSGRNGRQHNELDTLDAVDIGYVARVARLNVAIALNWALAPESPGQPEVISLPDGTLEVAWNAVRSADDVAGYRVALRADGDNYYSRIVDAEWAPGAPTRLIVEGLTDGEDLFVSVSAYDVEGNESVFSAEGRAVPELTATRTPSPSPTSTPTPTLTGISSRRHKMADTIRWFDELGMDDVPVVGGKNASLGEMRRALTPLGIQTADGFATTAEAFRTFLRDAGLTDLIRDALGSLDVDRIDHLQAAGARVRAAILSAALPEALRDEITDAYRQLEARYGTDCDVAVRSSATAEDLPEASFAGQQETYLNIHGEGMLLDAVRRCFASLFTDRAIVYRTHRGFDHMQVALSAGIQRMVRSDLASAGVMFSIDTETGFQNAVLINGAWGLGESVVQGTVNPDEFYVFKPTLELGFRPVLQKKLGTKEFKLVYEEGGSRGTRTVTVPADDRARFVLSDDEVLTLARWAMEVERHYSTLRGTPTPMDMEWAKDGMTGELFLVQARPETVHAQRSGAVLERYHLDARGDVIATGRSVGEKIGQGRARVIETTADLDQLQSGEVLVTEMTDPDWEPVMKRAAAVVTDRGGRTCHAAIVSRELGIPAVVGTGGGTSAIASGGEVTVSCAEGEDGFIYRGLLPIRVERTNLAELPRTRTEMMMNVANPAEAFSLSFLPNDGVGLARLEFIISAHVRTHPMALLHPERVTDLAERREIDRLTRGYADKGQYFVDKLAEGVAMIAAAFWPKDVIVRLSDFKTNEYAGLIGGAPFEPKEENPMIGFRGASRYYDPRYRDGFALECRAMLKVRDEMGLENVKLMVPFCRTIEEGRRVIAEMASHGLVQGERGLEVYVMCEIPANVTLASEFAAVFDGFSIGSNDLTQLVLGVDRDSELVAHLFDERDEAVTRTIASVIAAAHAAGRKIGICGQAPSDYPEFAAFLVREGIDSLSLNPDSQLKTLLAIAALEEEMDRGPSPEPQSDMMPGRERPGDRRRHPQRA